MTRMLDPGHICNVIYNVRSNKCHPPPSPNTAPATQNDSAKFQINVRKLVKCHLGWGDDPRPFREWSDRDPRMKPSVRNPPHNRHYFSGSEWTFSIWKYNISRTSYHSKFHQMPPLPRCHAKWLACLILVTYATLFTKCGATSVTLQLHQILHLPGKMNQSHAWSSSHMNLHCAKQQVSPSNLTKYCGCHTKWLACLILVTYENVFFFCAEQQVSPSTLTKCFACHAKRLACLILVAYETSLTIRGTTGFTLQPHQILVRISEISYLHFCDKDRIDETNQIHVLYGLFRYQTYI